MHSDSSRPRPTTHATRCARCGFAVHVHEPALLHVQCAAVTARERFGWSFDPLLLDGVEIWTERDEQQSIFGAGVRSDARAYAGPWPVVAHPPCERWGRYWHGGPSAKERRTKGDDGGCFASALASVRKWGGVLEHPEGSAAWPAFGLERPPKTGGWIPADRLGGSSCCVEQGHYGHRARKATWLYVHRAPLPDLVWSVR